MNGSVTKRNAVLSALAAAAFVAGCGGGSDSSSFDPASASRDLNNKKQKIDAPAVTCGSSGTTQTGLDLHVCAGATGALAGFTLQWMSAADLNASGGVWSDSAPSLCEASFSGNANSSRYDLGPNECVAPDLLVGGLLLDNGASTSCYAALTCGTDYVFRAFAHANDGLSRSDFTANVTCSTLACTDRGCTWSQGYWRNHGDWPVTGLALGSVTYTDAQLRSIFEEPVGGNGLVNLAHQLIAAKLNMAKKADASAVASDVAAADALIGALVVPPIGGGSLASSATSALVDSLTSFNEGATGPGHCE